MLSKMKRRTFLRSFTGLFSIIVLAYASSGIDATLIEDLSIPAGVSWDVEDKTELIYKQSLLIYGKSEEDTKSSDYIISSENFTPSGVREVRNSKLNKKFLSGFIRVYIISEKLSRAGIKDILDFTLITPQINDRVYFVVSKDKAFDVLNYTDKKNINAAEYIEGLIKTAPNYNFFSKNFTLIDIFMNTQAEGKNIVLPYVEISDEGTIISGLALFKSDKLIAVTDMKEAKYISLLKFNKGTGIITIQKSDKDYIDVLAKSKRKVKCYKNDDSYKFNIEINIKAEITGNEFYKNLLKDPEEIKKLENDVEKQVKKECIVYIEKIKKEYKSDILGLGSYAVAKSGRYKGVDWNEIVSESDIEVTVKAKVSKQGRGDF